MAGVVGGQARPEDEHEHTGEQKLTLTFNTPSRDEHPELVEAEVIDGDFVRIEEKEHEQP